MGDCTTSFNLLRMRWNQILHDASTSSVCISAWAVQEKQSDSAIWTRKLQRGETARPMAQILTSSRVFTWNAQRSRLSYEPGKEATAQLEAEVLELKALLVGQFNEKVPLFWNGNRCRNESVASLRGPVCLCTHKFLRFACSLRHLPLKRWQQTGIFQLFPTVESMPTLWREVTWCQNYSLQMQPIQKEFCDIYS